MPPDMPAAATNGPGRASGVIHDIGYRHYEGQRQGRGYIRRSLFVDSLRGAYGLGRSGRSKIMPLLLLAVMCVPAGVIVAVTEVAGAPRLFGEYPSYLLSLQIVIAIFVAAQAPVTVSRDLRFGVMSLYFSRPLERLDYVLSKYAAMSAAIFVLTAAPLVILFAGALLIGLPLSEQVPDFLRALGGAAVLSIVLAGIGLAIAAITPRRGLAVAAVITVLLVSSGVQAIAQEVVGSRPGGEGSAADAYASLVSPFTLVQGVQSSLFGGGSPLPVPPGATGAAAFVLVALLIVAACYGILALRYRSVSVT